MIIPDKLTNPNNCLIYYGYLISKHLKKYKSLKYETLEKYISKEIIDFSTDLFISTLDFLFTLGKIIYNIDKDEVVFIYEIE